tara:strand:- start:44 stop:397 length:354 start_codon:yes stop_codon:yes gene_type:complete
MITRSYDVEHADERKEFIETLEEAYRDTDWRSIGGFDTVDSRYASEVRDLLLTTMQFLLEFEDHHGACIQQLNDDIDEVEYRERNLDAKLSKIADWIADHTRLQKVTDIINDHRDAT